MHRRFTLWFLATYLVAAGLTLAVVVVIDPGWMFPFDHALNDRQTAYDERRQKSNYLAARSPRADTLLIGSSRTTFIAASDFNDHGVFNFAVSGVVPSEYPALVEYGVSHLEGTIDWVVVGLDFYGALEPLSPRQPLSPPGFADRLRGNFSWSMLELALGNALKSMSDDRAETYDRTGHRFLARKDAASVRAKFVYELRKLVEGRYAPSRGYEPRLRDLLASLPRRWPSIRFSAFTTPVSAEQFQGLVCQGRLADWERWLEDIVAAFGSVAHFMDLNAVTEDPSYWADSHHFYPEVGGMIARRLMEAEAFGSFGTVLDAGTLPGYLARIRDRAAAVDCSGLARAYGLTLVGRPPAGL